MSNKINGISNRHLTNYESLAAIGELAVTGDPRDWTASHISIAVPENVTNICFKELTKLHNYI